MLLAPNAVTASLLDSCAPATPTQFPASTLVNALQPSSTHLNSVWQACEKQLRSEIPPQQFDAWIRPLSMISANSELGDVELEAPNHFVAQWVRERFLSRIESIATNLWQKPTRVRLTLARDSAAAKLTTSAIVLPGVLPGPRPSVPPAEAVLSTSLTLAEPAASTYQPAAPPARPGIAAPSVAFTHTRLNPNYTLEDHSFVKGDSNQLAHAAALQVARNPGVSYNPLFIYGGVGLGKTHLAQAIGNHVFQNRPGSKVRYVHAEQFVTDVVKAYTKKSFDEFKRYYHSLDLLLIDDIQFFGGKDRTQQEFFYAFNALVEAHKQVVITCDTYPKEIPDIEERLTSRFGWGLSVAIEPPELEHRVAIIMNKAQRDRLALDESTAFFMAKHVRSNVRELEGALKKLQAYSEFHGQAITLESARDALKDLISVQRRQISLDNIQKTVADYYHIKVADMFVKKRTADLVKPRQVAMFLAKDMTSLSLPEIGDGFGGRDHTTVLHAVRKITEARKTQATLNHELHVLEQTLKG